MRFAAHFLGLMALASPASQIYSLAWAPDGATIALGGYKETRLVDAHTKKTVATLAGSAEAVRSVAFSRDGRLLAAAGGLPARKGEVKIWNASTRALVTTIAGHADCIYAAAFSPDGATIATASYDKLIKLWDVSTGKEIRTLRDHIDSIYALAFTPDGKRLVSGAADRSVKIWDVATGSAPLHALRAHRWNQHRSPFRPTARASPPEASIRRFESGSSARRKARSKTLSSRTKTRF